MKQLECHHVSVTIGSNNIVQDISFTLHEHEWLMLIGPNGAGKSTLLRAVSCSQPSSGDILLDCFSLPAMKPGNRARLVGMLSQVSSISGSYTVEEVVAMGRYSRSVFGRP